MKAAAPLLLVALCGLSALYAWKWMATERQLGRLHLAQIGPLRLLTGAVTNFFDTLGLACGGIPAVFLAAFVVKWLPLAWLRWAVVVIVFYAAAAMLRADEPGREETSPASRP